MATTTIGLGEIRDNNINDGAAITRSKMAQRVLAKLNIPLTDFRVWDALATNLPGTSATDDLALITGATFGTNAPYIGTSDLKAAGATTRRAGIFLWLPEDYEATETVNIRCVAGMITTIADVTATIDVEAYRIDEDGTLGAADLVTTAATTINNLTAANKDFVVTATDLVAGDGLMVRVTMAINDGATLTAVIGAMWSFKVLADLR
jgi:hypothetical protein